MSSSLTISTDFWRSSRPNLNGECFVSVSWMFSIVRICLSNMIYISFSVYSFLSACLRRLDEILVSKICTNGFVLSSFSKICLMSEFAMSVLKSQSCSFRRYILTYSPFPFSSGRNWWPMISYLLLCIGTYLFLSALYFSLNKIIFLPLNTIWTLVSLNSAQSAGSGHCSWKMRISQYNLLLWIWHQWISWLRKPGNSSKVYYTDPQQTHSIS